jgi:hypothetical protein
LPVVTAVEIINTKSKIKFAFGKTEDAYCAAAVAGLVKE